MASINFFNPRLREGGDNAGSGFLNIFKFSIHASAKEATSIQSTTSLIVTIFNPRLREGGDVYTGEMYPFLDDIFNPRLREGGDGKANKTEIKDIIFNPRLREGGDWSWI